MQPYYAKFAELHGIVFNILVKFKKTFLGTLDLNIWKMAIVCYGKPKLKNMWSVVYDVTSFLLVDISRNYYFLMIFKEFKKKVIFFLT